MRIQRVEVGLIRTNCYIVYGEKGSEAAIIDPGDRADKILRSVSELRVKVRYVILTHAHFDHTLAAAEVIKSTGAKLAAHPEEAPRLCDPLLSGHKHFRVRSEFNPLKADLFLNEGDNISFGGISLKVLHTPGHSEGSICLAGDGVLFSGDTLFLHECGRCDLFGGDYGLMLRSLKRLYDLPYDAAVYPGHGEPTTLSEERLANPYMREAVSCF